jgi:uncharacterized protein (DUF924 family)
MTPLRSQDPQANDVLDFWFGPNGVRGKNRSEWFQKNPSFDDVIRVRFLPHYEHAAAGHYLHWMQNPADCLALIVTLDQFPRNMFRDSYRSFAADHLARESTRHALKQGFDKEMLPVERMFVYLPLEHSESLADQELCVKLMKELDAFPETQGMHVWAEKHRVIIARFGRFPHRNVALGRRSTEEEMEFLKEPGSGF